MELRDLGLVRARLGPGAERGAVDDQGGPRRVVHADGRRRETFQIRLGEPDLLCGVPEDGVARILPGSDTSRGGGRPEERIAADRRPTELEENRSLGSLHEQLDPEGEPEPVGERRLLEDDHGLRVASGTAQDHAFRRHAVTEGDRTVEAARRPRERHPRISDGAADGPIERDAERVAAEAGLVPQENDGAHAQSLAVPYAPRKPLVRRRPGWGNERAVDGRTLVLGDWSPVVRDPIDVVRATFLVGAAAFALTGRGGAAALALAGIFTWLIRPLNLPRVYDASVVAALGLAAWGEALRAYDAFPAFDIVTHLLVPMLGAPVVYIALARAEVVPDPASETRVPHYVGIFVVTLALGLALGALWEILEFAADEVVGSQLSLGNRDTIGDLVADGAGALVGAALLVVWTIFGWGSVRRIPGENRFEERDA